MYSSYLDNKKKIAEKISKGIADFWPTLKKHFKNYNLYFGANNLFNKKYFDNIRINAFANRFYEPAPMRNYYAGINFKI